MDETVTIAKDVFDAICNEATKLRMRSEKQQMILTEMQMFLTSVINERHQYSYDNRLMANGYAHAKDLLKLITESEKQDG